MFNWRRRESREKPALLDEQYLARLETHLGEAALRELLSDGLLELSDRVGRIPGMVVAGDDAELSGLMHDIAGLSGHLGLTQLSHAAVAAGREVQQGRPAGSGAASPVLAAAPEAIAAIRYFLDDGAQSDGAQD